MTRLLVVEGSIALRWPEETDVAALGRECDDPEIARFTRMPSPYTEAHARDFVARVGRLRVDAAGDLELLVVPAGDGGPIGGVAVRPSLTAEPDTADAGYWVAAGSRGRGVARAALGAACRLAWARWPGLERIVLSAMAENTASRRVAERAGFRLVAVREEEQDCAVGVRPYAHYELGRPVEPSTMATIPG